MIMVAIAIVVVVSIVVAIVVAIVVVVVMVGGARQEDGSALFGVGSLAGTSQADALAELAAEELAQTLVDVVQGLVQVESSPASALNCAR